MFGCLAWVWTPEDVRKNKLEPRSQPMTFIGCDRGTKGWVFMRKDNSIFVGSHAKFNKLFFPRKDSKNIQKRPSPPKHTSSWDSDLSIMTLTDIIEFCHYSIRSHRLVLGKFGLVQFSHFW
jgi:hypothetical protein